MTRSITIADRLPYGEGRSYDEIRDIVNRAGKELLQVDDAAERGLDLGVLDHILLERLSWRRAYDIPFGASLTDEALRTHDYPVLVLKTFVITTGAVPPIGHTTVVVEGIVRDLDGIADETGRVKPEFQVEHAFVPPAERSQFGRGT
ncbi:hypothetical protein [Mycobacterium avium]|uniref:hypothetical protein n=1 Tax=Mycobacterium avium TaxID=1764 RepID=UPI000AF87F82|nr:hypothetical protein [Mycobacterium avium]